jgi:hypothetical protein
VEEDIEKLLQAKMRLIDSVVTASNGIAQVDILEIFSKMRDRNQ